MAPLLIVFFLIYGCCNGFSIPNQFTADVLRHYQDNPESTPVTTSRHLVVDVPSRIAYLLINTTTPDQGLDDGQYWLAYAPEGALNGYPEASSFVLFSLKKQFDGEIACTYTTSIELKSLSLPPTTFPDHWMQGDEVEMSDWFHFDEDLEKGDETTYHGIDVVPWYTKKVCELFGNHEKISCQLIFVEQDSVPVFYQFAYKHPSEQVFETDWLLTEDWVSFVPSSNPFVPLPSSWLSSCYNLDNGFNIKPIHGFVSTSNGLDHFDLSLTSRPLPLPVAEVSTTFEIVDGYCTDCISFQSPEGHDVTSLNFTADNWDVPQRVFMKYVKDGETYFRISATGGGYDITNWRSIVKQTKTCSMNLRVLTCANGQVGYGC